MTLNQLKYWELRWKQFYDMRMLEVDKAKLALEAAKLSETIRHNKQGEKLEKQRIVIERQKVSLEWAKLDETIRSNIVHEGIEAFKTLETQRHNLTEEQRKFVELLGTQAIAMGDLMVEAETAKNKNTVEFIRAYGDNVGEFLKAFGGGAAAIGLAELRSALGAANYDAILQSTIDQFPQFKGVLQTQGVTGVSYNPKEDGTIAQWYGETYGPQAPEQIKKDASKIGLPTKYPHDDGTGLVQGFSNTQSESGTSDKPKSTGSAVIYSGNSYNMRENTGPGVGISSTGSSVIYSGKG